VKTRCPICKEKKHISPSAMTPDNLFRHRITENRDCPGYEECLTEAALVDAVMVPCVMCSKFKRLH
jgi:hypothetical protein